MIFLCEIHFHVLYILWLVYGARKGGGAESIDAGWRVHLLFLRNVRGSFMKEFVLLFLLAGSLLTFSSSPAHAVDVSVDGEYLLQYQTGSLGFHGVNQDSNQQRVRLGLTFTAHENLSGYFQTESEWELGTNDGHDGMTSEGTSVGVTLRQAYIDWTAPGTNAKIRMGRHAFDLPAYASVSPIIADMVGDGVVLSLPFAERYNLTGFWTRIARGAGEDFQSKEYDIFGLIGNAKFDTLSLSPWLVYGAKGKGVEGEHTEDFENPLEEQGNIVGDAQADIFIGGLGAEWKPFEPLTLAVDGAYGHTNYSSAEPSLRDQEGWYLAAKTSYTLSFAEPALLVWYASGDGKHDEKYSGQVPAIYGDFDGTNTYFNAAYGIFGGNHHTIGGTWGISAQLNGISFLDSLSHDFSVTYFSGTNSKYNGAYGEGYDYLTTKDSAVEFNMLNVWEVYKNLSAALELAYLIEDFDTTTAHGRSGESYDNDWRVALNFQYTF